MATYIVLGNFTDQGRTAGNIPQRRARAHELAKGLGVSFTAYVTMGRYDVVWVVDAPNDESVAKLALSLGAAGNVTTQTMRAFTEAEVDELIVGLPAPPA